MVIKIKAIAFPNLTIFFIGLLSMVIILLSLNNYNPTPINFDRVYALPIDTTGCTWDGSTWTNPMGQVWDGNSWVSP